MVLLSTRVTKAVKCQVLARAMAALNSKSRVHVKCIKEVG